MTSISEAVESATGFDELAVKQKFGTPLGELLERDRLQGLRAIVFIQTRRDGKKDDEAYHIAQSLPLSDLKARFAEQDPEGDPEEDFVEPPRTTTP